MPPAAPSVQQQAAPAGAPYPSAETAVPLATATPVPAGAAYPSNVTEAVPVADVLGDATHQLITTADGQTQLVQIGAAPSAIQTVVPASTDMLSLGQSFVLPHGMTISATGEIVSVGTGPSVGDEIDAKRRRVEAAAAGVGAF
jgi:hypothetical protein